ncbi:uncharacterized protein C8A04DRAFT_29872 [Dichotomopilus funicola]|uniref:Ubiquitin-like protease family profile domain-containing protein n=1 Tax=Dichotomopilus funicola TaxID=1934379 RepID=A0AAN6V0A1_9PEZI|nr:hypothetical protein C8A04DRAFT_29872 [Dichotomopilus funicola]
MAGQAADPDWTTQGSRRHLELLRADFGGYNTPAATLQWNLPDNRDLNDDGSKLGNGLINVAGDSRFNEPISKGQLDNSFIWNTYERITRPDLDPTDNLNICRIWADSQDGLLCLRNGWWLSGESIFHLIERLLTYSQDQPQARLGIRTSGHWFVVPDQYLLRVIKRKKQPPQYQSYALGEVEVPGEKQRLRQRFLQAKLTLHISHHNNHWALVIYQRSSNMLYYLDSVECGREIRAMRARRAFQEWLARSNLQDVGYRSRLHIVDLLDQQNKWSCGLHVILNAVAVVRYECLDWWGIPGAPLGNDDERLEYLFDMRNKICDSLHRLMGLYYEYLMEIPDNEDQDEEEDEDEDGDDEEGDEEGEDEAEDGGGDGGDEDEEEDDNSNDKNDKTIDKPPPYRTPSPPQAIMAGETQTNPGQPAVSLHTDITTIPRTNTKASPAPPNRKKAHGDDDDDSEDSNRGDIDSGDGGDEDDDDDDNNANDQTNPSQTAISRQTDLTTIPRINTRASSTPQKPGKTHGDDDDSERDGSEDNDGEDGDDEDDDDEDNPNPNPNPNHLPLLPTPSIPPAPVAYTITKALLRWGPPLSTPSLPRANELATFRQEIRDRHLKRNQWRRPSLIHFATAPDWTREHKKLWDPTNRRILGEVGPRVNGVGDGVVRGVSNGGLTSSGGGGGGGQSFKKAGQGTKRNIEVVDNQVENTKTGDNNTSSQNATTTGTTPAAKRPKPSHLSDNNNHQSQNQNSSQTLPTKPSSQSPRPLKRKRRDDDVDSNNDTAALNTPSRNRTIASTSTRPSPNTRPSASHSHSRGTPSASPHQTGPSQPST